MNPEEQQFIGPQLPPVQGPQLPTRTITSDQAANNLFTQDAFYRIKDPVGVDNSDVFGVEQPTAPQVDTQLQGAQQFLNQAGFNAGPVDGIYGPKTQAGLTAFQQAQGIPTTGQLDDATRQAMTSFQFEPMPTPTIPKEVDITQIEGERPPRMEIPQQPDPFQSMIEGAAARSQQVMTQLSDQLKSQQEAVGGLEAQILQVLQEPGQRTLEEQLLKQSNVQQYQQELNQIYGRMQMLDVDLQRQKNTLERQGAVRSTEGFNRRQREAAQDIATEQMALMAQAQVLQGNIKLAQDYAKMAAETQAEQRMSQLEQLGLMYDTALRRAEETGNQLATERAQALKFQNDLAIGQLEEGMARYNNAVSIATEAIQRGADPKEVANFMDFARTNPQQAEAEAMARFGQALQTPTEAEALEQRIAEAELQGIQLRNRNLGLEADVYLQELNNAIGGSLPQLADDVQASRMAGDIGTLTSLIVDPKLNNATGVARPLFKSADYSDFTNAIDQIVKGKTLDQLVLEKEQGATFGALSDSELNILADSATIINAARRERNGKTLGYRMSDDALREELIKWRTYDQVNALRQGVQPSAIGVIETPDGYFAPDPRDSETFIKLPVAVQQ